MRFPEWDRKQIDSVGLSRLGCHGLPCCTGAKTLLLARLNRHVDVVARLAAVPAVVRWGPTIWPHHWCDLVVGDDLVGDCGVHADLVSHLLAARGIAHTRGRAALAVSPPAIRHWRLKWQAAGASDRWIGDEVVHHEVIGIGGRWWDPTEARWFDGPGSALGDGRVVAVRESGGTWQKSPDAAP